jgi:hypothetical protein
VPGVQDHGSLVEPAAKGGARTDAPQRGAATSDGRIGTVDRLRAVAVAGAGTAASYVTCAVRYPRDEVDRAHLATDALLLGVLCLPACGVLAVAGTVHARPAPPAEQRTGVVVHGRP